MDNELRLVSALPVALGLLRCLTRVIVRVCWVRPRPFLALVVFTGLGVQGAGWGGRTKRKSPHRRTRGRSCHLTLLCGTRKGGVVLAFLSSRLVCRGRESTRSPISFCFCAVFCGEQ
ncbi:hypothetical protein K438DRAFT_358440 [Mycena galopus ATCC 62051]|nr:hypothetical protein K438DRAFT_358440 [Mycena galopus ATCC 62051]